MTNRNKYLLKGRKILLLGAGKWQVPYLLKAKELGLQVFATDWDPNAPGAQIADHFEPISLTDTDNSLAFAKSHGIEAILTAADIGVPTAAFIASKLDLPYHDPELANEATNKGAMREKALKLGIAGPKLAKVTSLNDAILQAKIIGYPVITKPVDNCASRGVFYLANDKELTDKFLESISQSRTNEILIEKFMHGREGSIELVVKNGIPTVLGICEKVKSPLPFRYDLQLVYPGDYQEEILQKINKFIEQLVEGYKIKRGIVHVEFLIEEDEVKLIEFALRGCGSNVITHLLPAILNFDIVSYLIHEAFDQYQEYKMEESQFGMLKFMVYENTTITNVGTLESVLACPGIVDAGIDITTQTYIDRIKDGRSRQGYMIGTGKNKEELLTRMTYATGKFNEIVNFE